MAQLFQQQVKANLKSVGTRPVTFSGAIFAKLRGGPATLFDGPERGKWRSRVKALGAAAAAECARQDNEFNRWLAAKGIDMGEEYLTEVDKYIAERRASDNPNSGMLAMAAEQAAEEWETRYARQTTPTTVRIILPFVLAVAGGSAIGYAADDLVQATPQWLDTTAGASLAALVAALPLARREKVEGTVEAAVLYDKLLSIQRSLTLRLRRLVNQLVRIVDPNIRADPDRPLTEPAILALTILGGRLKDSRTAEVTLYVTDQRRTELVRLARELELAAEDHNLIELDMATATAIDWVSEAVERLGTGTLGTTYEESLELGQDFIKTLRTCIHIASRIDGTVGAEAPDNMTGVVLKAA